MATLAPSALSESELDVALKALASAHRREIVRFLLANSGDPGKTCCSAEEICACKLSEHLGLSASTVSHHMAALRDGGLVTARKEGTWVYYAVRRDVLAAVAAAVEGL